MQIRKSSERGHANHGWLDSYHSFSFSHYYDKDWMGYSVLRVINEDVIAPAQGFGMHSHQDMEIITYILQGELSHKDSLGNVETIHQGHVQRMTAGSGITHSEFNASTHTPVHLLQIWILPNQLELRPGYEDGFFSNEQKQDKWCLLASEKGEKNSLIVHQDMALYATKLSEHKQLTYQLVAKRCVYVQVATGTIELNGQVLEAGDAAMFADNELITLKTLHAAELLLFDLPQ